MISYREVKEKLTSKGMFRINTGLERVSEILNLFENPHLDLKCIHVAGTNGKGSVCAMLSSILSQAGYKTGLYTSPHIFEYTERIKINGKDISQEDFSMLFEEVFFKARENNIDLTEFEILTVMMFLYFKRNNTDVVVLETGMGGRFDATNVIKENLCAIITQIDLDHTDRLGKTRDLIAFEKAGIIKPNCPVITSMGYEAIRDKADEMNSMFILVSPSVPEKFSEALSLKGLHQIENLALVLSAAEYLFKDIPEETILKGLEKVKHPFRFEYIKEKNLIIDGSHNPNGIQALRENLDYFFPNMKRRFIFGALKTKDYQKMMNILFREDDEIMLYEFDYKDSASYEELSSKCPFPSKRYTAGLSADRLNIICGSFYMLKELLSKI